MSIFRIGVMPALARLPDEQFVPAMRRINEAVPRAAFLMVFAAVVVFPALALAVPVEGRTDAGSRLVLAGLVCAVLGHAVTVVGNIPLNNALAAAGTTPDSEAREAFEARWNRFHAVRTLLALVAFASLVLAALV
jgi:uncharacterized membrane protein